MKGFGFGVLVILCFWFGGAVSDKSFGGDYGDYAIAYLGVDPKESKDNDFVEWKAELTVINKKWRDKRLSADVTIKEKLGPIGMRVTYYEKDKSNKWAHVTIDDACESSVGLEYFEECFTRVNSGEDGEDDTPAFNAETCTIEPGEYVLSNWTIEPHMKKKVGPGFPYGIWAIEVTIFGPGEEGPVDYATVMLHMEVLNKKARDHQREVKKKRKKNEHEPDHPEPEDFDPSSGDHENFGPPKWE